MLWSRACCYCFYCCCFCLPLELRVQNFLTTLSTSALVNVTEAAPSNIELSYNATLQPQCIPQHYNVTTVHPDTWLVYSDEPVSVMASLTLGNGVTFVWVKDGQVVGDNSCEDVGCRSDNRVSPDYYIIYCE